MITLDTDDERALWRSVVKHAGVVGDTVTSYADAAVVAYRLRLPKPPEPSASGHAIDKLVTKVEYEHGEPSAARKPLVPRREAVAPRAARPPEHRRPLVPRREASVPRAALIEAAEKAVNTLEVPERVALFQRYPTSAGTALATMPAVYSAREAIAETDLPPDMSSADAIRTLWERLRAKV